MKGSKFSGGLLLGVLVTIAILIFGGAFAVKAFAAQSAAAAVTGSNTASLQSSSDSSKLAESSEVGEVEDSSSVNESSSVFGSMLTSDSSSLNETETETETEVEDSSSSDDVSEQSEEIEFTGIVASISPTLWMVGDKNVVVSTETEIEGSAVVGDTVKVEAVLQSDGTYLAKEIKVGSSISSGSGDSNSGSDDSMNNDGQNESDDDSQETSLLIGFWNVA